MHRPGVMFTSVVCFSLKESEKGSAPHVLLGNLDGVKPDGSLHLAHADGPPCDIAPSTRGNPDGVDPDSLAARDISHPDGRGRHFNFPG